MVKIIAWNIGHRTEPWRELIRSDADIALLTEAAEPPPDVAGKVEVDPAPWFTTSVGANCRWRAAIVRLSDRVGVTWIKGNSIQEAKPGEVAISRPGTLAAAVITPSAGEPFIAVAMYSAWERPMPDVRGDWIYADASVHRLISDLSAFVGTQSGHRILAAGDLNILHGYGEHGNCYWGGRYASCFSRLQALGLTFVGPQAPDGRQADPWPAELPVDSRNVPTYHTNHQRPETATRQLDFAFASSRFAKNVRVRARNEPEEWGPSDHCRLEIEVST